MGEPRTPSPIVGILGGMGPAATVDFYDKLVRATPAHHDQDHLRTVIWADPTVPDRHAPLGSGGTDPTPWLRAGIEHLRGCGAELLVCPCNTAHAYLPAALRRIDVEFVSMIDVTVSAASHSGAEAVGLLAADGALAADLYQSALQAAGMRSVLLDAAHQERLMQSIGRVKAATNDDEDDQRVNESVNVLGVAGADVVIAGCTEVSVLLENPGRASRSLPVIDSSWQLAHATVARARRGLPRSEDGCGAQGASGQHLP